MMIIHGSSYEWIHLVLKGTIEYSDYSFKMVIFKCFENFVFSSHLCTLAVCLLAL